MDWKKILQQGGLVLLVALIFYGSGWQYYLGLFHGFGGSVYFVVPWDAALGRGFPSVITIAIVSTLGYLAGYAVRSFRGKRDWGMWIYVFAAIPCLLGYFMPKIGELFGVPRIAEEVSRGHLRFMPVVIATLLFAYFIAFLNLRKPTEPTHYFMYAVLLVSFVCATFFYSTLLGRAAARPIPIMEKGDELVVVRCGTQQTTTLCKEMVIKKMLIKSVNF